MSLLLHAKRQASENRDHTFEHILLETGKACDEKIHEGADLTLLENFSYVITYFDRYDNTSALINQLAFMENVQFGEEQIRSLLGNKKEFDELDKKLWKELFFKQVFDNKYLGHFGRKKVTCLQKGLAQIEDGTAKVEGNLGVLEQLASAMVEFDLGFEILPGTARPGGDVLNDFEVGPIAVPAE